MVHININNATAGRVSQVTYPLHTIYITVCDLFPLFMNVITDFSTTNRATVMNKKIVRA